MQRIEASDRAASDFFGLSVSISGDYVIVGAYFEEEDASGGNRIVDAGSAYLFERDGAGNWNEVQKIVASDRAANDTFGSSVSISGDYAIVGAFAEDNPSGVFNNNAGSAYLFERDGAGNWSEVQKIVDSDRAKHDRFGYSVSISGDYAIVGAYTEDENASGENTLIDAGSAYLFKRDGAGNWNEMQKIVASNRAENDYFGWSVSISGDYAIVGALNEDPEPSGGGNPISDAGSAYVFELSSILGTDTQTDGFDTTLTFYPNPTNGNVTINFKKQYTNLSVTVTDITGKQISVFNFGTRNQVIVNIEGVKGIYFISISTGEGKTKRLKVIKN